MMGRLLMRAGIFLKHGIKYFAPLGGLDAWFMRPGYFMTFNLEFRHLEIMAY